MCPCVPQNKNNKIQQQQQKQRKVSQSALLRHPPFQLYTQPRQLSLETPSTLLHAMVVSYPWIHGPKLSWASRISPSSKQLGVAVNLLIL